METEQYSALVMLFWAVCICNCISGAFKAMEKKWVFSLLEILCNYVCKITGGSKMEYFQFVIFIYLFIYFSQCQT